MRDKDGFWDCLFFTCPPSYFLIWWKRVLLHHTHHFKEICFSGTANPLGGPVAGDQAVAERSHDEPEIVCAWNRRRLRKGEPEIVWSTKLLDHCQRIWQKLLSQPSRSQQPYLQNPYPKTQHRYLTLFTINLIGVPIHETWYTSSELSPMSNAPCASSGKVTDQRLQPSWKIPTCTLGPSTWP